MFALVFLNFRANPEEVELAIGNGGFQVRITMNYIIAMCEMAYRVKSCLL